MEQTKGTEQLLGKVLAIMASEDTDKWRETNANFVPVNFKIRTIYAKAYTYAAWQQRGYRQYRQCQPVREDFIAKHADAFSIFTDER